MRMIPVESSNIKAVGWEPTSEVSEHGTLRVEFRNGAVYEYDDVPRLVFTELVGAESVGAYFHREIKGRYPTRKVED